LSPSPSLGVEHACWASGALVVNSAFHQPECDAVANEGGLSDPAYPGDVSETAGLLRLMSVKEDSSRVLTGRRAVVEG